MAQTTLATLDNAMRTWYLPVMQQLLNNATVLFSRINKDSSNQTPDGRQFTVAIHSARNDLAGVGIVEGGTFPTAGNQGYIQAIVPNKYTYTAISLSGPVIRATRTNAGAFVRAAQSEIQGAMTDMQHQINKLMNGDGTGFHAVKTDNTNTSPFNVDDGQGFSEYLLLTGQTQRMDVLSGADFTTLRNTGQIVVTRGANNATGTNTAVTFTGGTITGSAQGDLLIRRGATPGMQMQGLKGIISNVDPPNVGGLLPNGLHGLAVGVQPNWASQIVGSEATRTDLSTALVQRVITKIARNSAFTEQDIKFAHMSPETRDKFAELVIAERGFFNEMEMDGGFSAISYNTLPFVTDIHCRQGRINLIVPEALSIFRTADFTWVDDGAILRQNIDGTDSYIAQLFHYGDLACLVRNCLGALIGLNV